MDHTEGLIHTAEMWLDMIMYSFKETSAMSSRVAFEGELGKKFRTVVSLSLTCPRTTQQNLDLLDVSIYAE